jgi:hypothetical protein
MAQEDRMLAAEVLTVPKSRWGIKCEFQMQNYTGCFITLRMNSEKYCWILCS